jgi:SAM-dependent methyltransferase
MDNYESATLYGAAAAFYDLDNRPVTKDDIPFYLARAASARGSVLELACGTGRVTIPLALAGHEIWGIDLSQQMLAQFKGKMDSLSADVRVRITLKNADMRSFELQREFSLIIVPFRGFQALTGKNGPRACLGEIRRHLADDGRFILDVFRPRRQLDDSWIQPETTDWEAIEPNSGDRVRRTHIDHRIDVQNQVIYSEQFYYVTRPDGSEERQVNPITLKYYYEWQLRDLIQSAGFEIVEQMGYYDGRPIEEGPEMIFVCQKVSRETSR